MHNLCTEYCLGVIRAVMEESTVPKMPEGLSLQELFDFSKLHNVEAMVFHGLEQLQPDEEDPLWQHWQNRADMLMTQSIVQLADRDTLFAALPAAGIRILPVKGCWLKEQYPDIDYRQMSDLDILIPKEKAEDAAAVMRALGYKPGDFDDNPRHTGYLKAPYTGVELHTSLLYEDRGYYDDVWNRAEPVADCPGVYRFRAEDEYIFYLLHLHKHLNSAGTGIRSVLDSLVFRQAYPGMDRHYLRKELEKWGLWELAEDIETLADCWFKTGSSVPEQLREMAEFILSAGSYGTLENRYQRRLDKLEKRYKNPFLRAIAYWIGRICRPMKEMKRSYPVLHKLPFLLPFLWIHRAIVRFCRRPKEVRHHIAVVFGRGKKHG